MREPDNHTVRVLREIRTAIQALDKKVDTNHQEVKDRLKSLQQAITGESVLAAMPRPKSRSV